jgi:hypothetical protein
MSDETKKTHRKPWQWRGATIVTLAGGVVGGFVGGGLSSQDGRGDDYGALGVVLGVPIGLIVGIGAYAIVKMVRSPDGRDGMSGEPDDKSKRPPMPRRSWSRAMFMLALMLIAIFLFLNLAALIIGS